jgi:hypothetical protein
MKLKKQMLGRFMVWSFFLLTVASGLQKPASATAETSFDSAVAEAGLSFETSSDSETPLISYYVNQRFLLNNGSPRTMTHFYASPSNTDDWEEDIFGSSVLSSNDSIWVIIQDLRETCRYDFRAVFSDGSESTHYGINVCSLAEYTFN